VMATVLQAYQFALDPVPRTQGSLASHTGAALFAYNWGLELVKSRLDQRRADHDVEVPWTLPELRREWNRVKHQVAPWWQHNSKEAYNSGLDALARALRNWSDSRNRRRNGRPMGFPRRKKKRRARAACRFTTGAIRVLPDRKHVQLPRIGVVKTHESTGSWREGWSGAPPGSWPPPSPVGLTAGTSPSPSKSNGRSRPATASRVRSGWTSGSGTWQCSPLAR
jgi:transposase